MCFDSYVRPFITILTCFMTVYLCHYKLMKKKEYHTWIKLNVPHDTIVTRSDEGLALETLALESLYGS